MTGMTWRYGGKLSNTKPSMISKNRSSTWYGFCKQVTKSHTRYSELPCWDINGTVGLVCATGRFPAVCR